MLLYHDQETGEYVSISRPLSLPQRDHSFCSLTELLSLLLCTKELNDVNISYFLVCSELIAIDPFVLCLINHLFKWILE